MVMLREFLGRIFSARLRVARGENQLLKHLDFMALNDVE